MIGPWFLATLREELSGGPGVSYLVLRVPEAEALRRVREREGPGASTRVRHMVAAFADLGPLQSHALDTARRTADEVLALAAQGLADGRFRLGW